ncbi:hypothetical protein B0H13DRAFT_1886374 [Mycena leptocephala]|nr:hypothetical protein B0H13DRAFT_1886374 [Mycena leptocephala]
MSATNIPELVAEGRPGSGPGREGEANLSTDDQSKSESENLEPQPSLVDIWHIYCAKIIRGHCPFNRDLCAFAEGHCALLGSEAQNPTSRWLSVDCGDEGRAATFMSARVGGGGPSGARGDLRRKCTARSRCGIRIVVDFQYAWESCSDLG